MSKPTPITLQCELEQAIYKTSRYFFYNVYYHFTSNFNKS